MTTLSSRSTSLDLCGGIIVTFIFNMTTNARSNTESYSASIGFQLIADWMREGVTLYGRGTKLESNVLAIYSGKMLVQERRFCRRTRVVMTIGVESSPGRGHAVVQ